MLVTRIDPTRLRAFVLLEQRGMDQGEICRSMRISRRTFFRYRREARRVEQEAERLIKADI
jgi:predicted DNA-binding protein (UPF0251 family)